ncbi:triphosphoribosyl-dephospho-CoA synthase [Halobacteriales archaeon QS_3_64_16]|nr:MAG: triphosphoribosyl-dephospho-CoA synthase [Halobacteriales archaeon QS_3_64_16]
MTDSSEPAEPSEFPDRTNRDTSRTPAENAQLALLLEVAGTPKPGNVDREHEYPDLRFEHFLAGAVGAREGLAMAEAGEPVGEAFERAVRGMATQRGGNTHFGALLLLAPLVRAAAAEDLTSGGVAAVVASTTVEDASDFYRAFEHVDVAVADPPEGWGDLDVRRGERAIPTLRERDLTLQDVMESSAERDGVAREWVARFERSFRLADRLAALEGSVTERAARAYLEALAAEPDTFVAINHDVETAHEVTDRAAAVLSGEESVEEFAEELIEREINPGTTADITAAGLFVALERGLEI